ncbi:MAG: rod shape-determining protein MreC [Desulfovibrionaceae bacterium]|nr:rod shape-determining protein MreC [Desulfovibrionaceae bacterium]
MSFRKILICTGILLVLFLSLYAWNRSTGILDDFSTKVGLEAVGAVLNPFRQAQSAVVGIWDDYVALTDVRRENKALAERVRELEAQILKHREDLAELRRLRELLKLPVDVSWNPVGARVLAGRLGPNSRLESFSINRGYVNGATPGTPVVTNLGLLGRVQRSSAHTSTVFLLTNPMSRIAIFTQKTRSPGILTGNGPNRPLEALYVSRDTKAEVGELLVTSGLDGKFPKGIPVARITSLKPSNYTEFMTISAEPLADLQHIEEVLLLEPTGTVRPPEPATPRPEFVGPLLPDFLKKDDPEKAPGGM